MQRQLSSFDINVMVYELQEIIDSPIDKIYQLSKNEILIKIKNKNTNKKESLLIRNGKFLALTDKQLKTPKTPSNFVMALRKYLKNGRILRIYQHEFDRILKIEIGKKIGKFTLVIEFFSEGNIILVDPNGNIIIPFIRQSWSHRKVKGRQSYVPPPSQIDPFTISNTQFSEIIKESNADIVRTLAVKLNLSGPIAEEICFKAKIEKKKQTSELDEREHDSLFSILKDFLTIFEKNTYQPMLIKKEENILDILPIPFQSYDQKEMIPTNHFTRGLSNFIEDEKTQKEEEQVETKTDKNIGKFNRILLQQQEKIKILDKNIEQKKQEGEIIYLHYNKVDTFLKTIQQSMSKKEKQESIEKINSLDFVKIFDPLKNKLIISLPDANNVPMDISLQFRKSITENAENAYDESKKSNKKKHGAEKSVKKTQETLNDVKLEKQKEEENQEEKTRFVKKKKRHFWFERYRWSISTEGNLITAGKDTKTNEQLIKKHLEAEDRYVHADIHGAPSCIVKRKSLDDKPLDISTETLEEACILAACYSRAWKQFTEAQSYWVLPQQVSKTPQSGEFVPKGAFIIRGKRNYYKCILEMGIGQLNLENEKRWIGGSTQSIKKWCNPYIIIKPGGMSRKDFSHMIAKKTESSSDEINQVLPPGGISITQSKGIQIEKMEKN